jgi:tetratricopeptide (TPR) repeat protein
MITVLNKKAITFLCFFGLLTLPAFTQIQTTSEFQEAMRALSTGEYNNAVTSLEQLLKTSHRDNAYIELGKIKQRQAESELSAALNHFYEAAEMLSLGLSSGAVKGPEVPKLLYDLGNIYEERLKDYPKAIETYQQIIDNYPTFMTIDKVYYNIAGTYELVGKYEEASEYYSIIVSDFSYSTYFSTAQEKMKKLSIGTKTQDSAIDIQENIAYEADSETEMQANIDLGDMQADAGQYKRAASSYRNALRAAEYPEDAIDIYRKLVSILEEKLKDYNGATAAIEEMLSRYPNVQGGEDLVYRLGRMYESDLDNMKKTVDSSGNVRYRKSRENLTKAADYYSKVINNYPYSDAAADAYLRQGEIYGKELWEYGKARRAYESFLRNFPDHSEASSVRRKLEELEGY